MKNTASRRPMRSLSGRFDGLQGCRSAAMPNCSSRACSILQTANRMKANRRFLRSWLYWSDARLRRASSELEKLGWLCRKSSVTPAGDRAATKWRLPRIVIQPAKQSGWRGCPVRDKADHIRTHKKGDRARTREHEGEQQQRRVISVCPRLTGFRSKGVWAKFKPSLLRLVGRKKRLGAQRSLPSNAATILPWAGPSLGVRNGSMSARKHPSPTTPNTRSPTRSESREDTRNVGGAMQSRLAKSWIVGSRNTPLAESPGDSPTSDPAHRSQNSRYDPQWLPTAGSGNQRRNLLLIPPHSGNRKSTPTAQNECQSKHPQTIHSPANPRRREI